MKPEEIRTIAQQLHIKLPMATQEDAENFLITALAAINAKAEPAAYAVVHGDRVVQLSVTQDPFYPHSIPLYPHPATEPAQQAAFDQEIQDADELLRLLNLDPQQYRTDGGYINMPKVKAAVREPWDYPTIEPVNPPVPARVGAAPLPDAQLCRFYDVDNFPDLVAAMDHHIEKLQAKLPPTPSLKPTRVREG